MKIIITKTQVNLGKEGEVIEVSEGYARNYLFPRKFACEADAASLQKLEKSKSRIEKKHEQLKDEMQAAAKKLGEAEIEITADAGEAGKLFGSVTGADIAAQIKTATGIEIDKRKVILGENIKMAGVHDVTVKLLPDVETKIKITVKAKTK